MKKLTDQNQGAQRPSFINRIFYTPLGLRREIILLVLILVMIAVIPFFNQYFLRFSNLRLLLVGNFHLILMAIGMSMLLVFGEIDLSIGSIMAFSGMVAAIMLKKFDLPIPVAILAALLSGVGIGLINGFFIVKIGINFLIMTLAMMGIARGLVIVMSESGIANLPKDFNLIGQSIIFGLQVPVWVTFALVAIFAVLLAKHKFFRQLYFIGGNREAAKLIGINVDRARIAVYALSGAMAAVAGILNTARFGAAVPTAGSGAELAVISATVLGGASLLGGQGTVIGALIGVMFLGVLSNVLIMLSVPTFWHNPINGVVLVLALTIDILVTRMRNARQRRATLGLKKDD